MGADLQRARQLAHESDLHDWAAAIVRQLERRGEQDLKWGNDLVEQVENAFKEGTR